MDALQQALQFDPEFAPARVDTAVYWARNNQPDKAESEFRLTFSQQPYYPKASYNYGAFLFENGRFTEARDLFRRTLDLAPSDLKAHFALITTHDVLGDRNAANDALEQIAPESQEAAIARNLLAVS